MNVTNLERLTVSLTLTLDCRFGETCDYTNTGVFNWVLPSNVTVTSDSGVFLTQAGETVPEPAASR